MAKCRGCGEDTREYEGGPGWMHYKCEIERLLGHCDELETELERVETRLRRVREALEGE